MSRISAASSAVGRSPVGIEVVRGDHLDDLVLLGPPRRREEAGRGEVLRLALGLREHLVRDLLDDVLQEGVLAALGRARIGLHRDDLLAQQRGEQRLELVGVAPAERRQPELGERLAEHRGVLDDAPLLGAEPVEPRRDQRVQRLGHLERLDHAGRPVDVALLDEEAAVEQHPHGLDRVQRHALGAGEDAARADPRAGPGTRPVSSSLIACSESGSR